jgi:hypothetical protein
VGTKGQGNGEGKGWEKHRGEEGAVTGGRGEGRGGQGEGGKAGGASY